MWEKCFLLTSGTRRSTRRPIRNKIAVAPTRGLWPHATVARYLRSYDETSNHCCAHIHTYTTLGVIKQSCARQPLWPPKHICSFPLVERPTPPAVDGCYEPATAPGRRLRRRCHKYCNNNYHKRTQCVPPPCHGVIMNAFQTSVKTRELWRPFVRARARDTDR